MINVQTTVILGRTFSRGRGAHQFLPRFVVENHGARFVRIAHPANRLRVLLAGEEIRGRIHRHHLTLLFRCVHVSFLSQTRTPANMQSYDSPHHDLKNLFCFNISPTRDISFRIFKNAAKRSGPSIRGASWCGSDGAVCGAPWPLSGGRVRESR